MADARVVVSLGSHPQGMIGNTGFARQCLDCFHWVNNFVAFVLVRLWL